MLKGTNLPSGKLANPPRNDKRQPFFFWQIESEQLRTVQTAYRVQARSDSSYDSCCRDGKWGESDAIRFRPIDEEVQRAFCERFLTTEGKIDDNYQEVPEEGEKVFLKIHRINFRFEWEYDQHGTF